MTSFASSSRAGKIDPNERLTPDQFQQITDRAMGLDGVTQVLAREHFIVVFATNFFASNEPLFFQILHDPLHGPFGNPDLDRHLAEHQIGVRIERDQDVRVIGQERPAAGRG